MKRGGYKLYKIAVHPLPDDALNELIVRMICSSLTVLLPFVVRSWDILYAPSSGVVVEHHPLQSTKKTRTIGTTYKLSFNCHAKEQEANCSSSSSSSNERLIATFLGSFDRAAVADPAKGNNKHPRTQQKWNKTLLSIFKKEF